MTRSFITSAVYDYTFERQYYNMQILKDNKDEMTLIDFKSELFKTMGHPTRLRILELLRTGEKTVGELQQALDIDASSVSQQLAVMRTRQLVDARKQGTSVFYTVRDELVFQIMDIARQMFQNHVTNMQSILEDQDQLSEAGRSS